MSAATSPKPSPPVPGTAPTPPTRRSARASGDLCPCCGRHALRPARRPGRACRYRNLCLTLPAELPVPTCRLCKHMVLTYEAVPELAATLKQVFRAELVHRAAAEITQLSRFCSQRKLELALDLSQGYLCRLRAGQGVPSVVLVSLMALLRAEPARLEELHRYWALPLESPPSRVGRRRAP